MTQKSCMLVGKAICTVVRLALRLAMFVFLFLSALLRIASTRN